MKRSISQCVAFKCLLLSLFFSGCATKFDTDEVRDRHFQSDWEFLEKEQPIIHEPLTFPMAVEIALQFNFDVFAQQYERETQSRIANAQNLRMLPALTIDGVDSYRFKSTDAFQDTVYPANTPEPVSNPLVKPFPQISSSQQTRQITFRNSLSLLDLGLAYFRTSQEKNKTLMVEHQQLRTRQKLVLDLSQAYWRAAVAHQGMRDTEALIAFMTQFEEGFQKHLFLQNLSQIQGLYLHARLLDQQIQLEGLRYQYEQAKAELAGLMGLLPGISFELADFDLSEIDMIADLEIKNLEELALKMRPELYGKDVEEQIAIEKIRENFLQLVPNFSLYEDYNYDGNPYLVYHYWWSVGSRIAWNLFTIPQQMQMKRSAEAQREFAYFSRIALSCGVVSQVHVAYIGYRQAKKEYELTLSSFDIRSRLVNAGERALSLGDIPGIDVLDFKTNAVIAKIAALKAFAALKVSQEQINYAIGKPLYLGNRQEVDEPTDGTLEELSEELWD